VVPYRGGVLVIDDPLSLLSLGIWLFAAGMWPVGFLFGACSPCCDQDQCPRFLSFERCLYFDNVNTSPQTGGTTPVGLSGLGISNVQSQIQITVQISISASGASRTPIGDIRTQVWRFNRDTPTNPAAYDVLGPAWHLEVELSVTGVATQAEAGVTTSIGVDSEGQPKLFVVVNQWTTTITRDEVVTLFPVGLQRWGSGTQTFRLSGATATATRVSGDNYSGWTVSKLSGITILSRELAVQLDGRILLNENAAINFLNGVSTLTGTTNPIREYRILPNNPLCGSTDTGLAIRFGVLPSTLTVTYPQSVRDADPFFCEESVALAPSCGGVYFGRWDHIRRSLVTETVASVDIIWGIINGVQGSPGSPTLGRYNGRDRGSTTGPAGSCPPGTGHCHRIFCLPGFVEITVAELGFTGTAALSCNASAPVGAGPSLVAAYSISPSSFGPPWLALVPTNTSCWQIILRSVTVTSNIEDYCEDSGELQFTGSTDAELIGGPGANTPECPISGFISEDETDFFTVFPPLPTSPPPPPGYSNISSLLLGPLGTSSVYPTDFFPSTALPVSWTVSSYDEIPSVSTIQDPPDETCVLDNASTDGITAPGGTSNVAAQAGDCFYARLRFSTPAPCSTLSHSECDSCTPEVTIVSGAEYARVTYIASGEKANLIEIVALSTWLAGQGVTYTVTCNGSTTHTLLRAFEVPTPPQNLTVVRGPCSEAFLEWQAPEYDGGTPITAYSIEFRRVGVAAWATFGTVSPPALSATVAGLVRVGYEFRVLAVNSVGNSAESNIAQNGFVLGAPTNLTFNRDPCNRVQLSWTPPAQTVCAVVANYRLERRFNFTGEFVDSGTVAGTATTGTITGLLSTGRYEFRVARIVDDGPDLFSNTVTSGTVPAVPTNVVGSLGVNSGEVNLVWGAVEQQCFPNTDYNVQFRPSTTNTWSSFFRTASANKFATVTGLTSGVTYFFRVRASNTFADSSFSEQSNSVTIP
jgi:hypothetical protein